MTDTTGDPTTADGSLHFGDGWILELPFQTRCREDDDGIVLWVPGFALWIRGFEYPSSMSLEDSLVYVAATVPDDAHERRETRTDELVLVSWRAKDDGRDVLYVFGLQKERRVELAFFLKREKDLPFAHAIAESLRRSTPTAEPRRQKTLALPPHKFRAIVPDLRGGVATDRVMTEGAQVERMARVEPEFKFDSGWRLQACDDSVPCMLGASNAEVYALNTIANIDATIVPFLGEPIGSLLVRDSGGAFVPIR